METGVVGYWVKPPGARAVFVQHTATPEEIREFERAKITAMLLAEISSLEERYKIHKAGSSKRGKIPPPALVRAIACHEAHLSGVTADQILGGRHTRKYAWPRQSLYARLRGYGYSLPGIGLALGVHHTTVLSGLRRAKERARAGKVPES